MYNNYNNNNNNNQIIKVFISLSIYFTDHRHTKCSNYGVILLHFHRMQTQYFCHKTWVAIFPDRYIIHHQKFKKLLHFNWASHFDFEQHKLSLSSKLMRYFFLLALPIALSVMILNHGTLTLPYEQLNCVTSSLLGYWQYLLVHII